MTLNSPLAEVRPDDVLPCGYKRLFLFPAEKAQTSSTNSLTPRREQPAFSEPIWNGGQRGSQVL